MPATARSGDDARNVVIASGVSNAIRLGVASCCGDTLLAVAVLVMIACASVIFCLISCTFL